MRLVGALRYLVALTVVVTIAAIGGAPQLEIAPSPLLMFPLVFEGAKFQLQEVDVGAAFGCPDRRYVGVILKDSHGIVRWSFDVADTQSYLARSGCFPELNDSRIAGVAVPTSNVAVWVVRTHICGASCFGLDVHVFKFSPEFVRIDPATGLYTVNSVTEEVHKVLGLGGLRFQFPRLTLYINNDYKDCPSHLTRMIYEWSRVDNYPQVKLVDQVTYTSQTCYLRRFHELIINQNNHPWPPDPGE